MFPFVVSRGSSATCLEVQENPETKQSPDGAPSCELWMPKTSLPEAVAGESHPLHECRASIIK